MEILVARNIVVCTLNCDIKLYINCFLLPDFIVDLRWDIKLFLNLKQGMMFLVCTYVKIANNSWYIQDLDNESLPCHIN